MRWFIGRRFSPAYGLPARRLARPLVVAVVLAVRVREDLRVAPAGIQRRPRAGRASRGTAGLSASATTSGRDSTSGSCRPPKATPRPWIWGPALALANVVRRKPIH